MFRVIVVFVMILLTVPVLAQDFNEPIPACDIDEIVEAATREQSLIDLTMMALDESFSEQSESLGLIVILYLGLEDPASAEADCAFEYRIVNARSDLMRSLTYLFLLVGQRDIDQYLEHIEVVQDAFDELVDIQVYGLQQAVGND